MSEGYSAIGSGEEEGEMGAVNSQPSKKDSLRYQAIMAAVAAGCVPLESSILFPLRRNSSLLTNDNLDLDHCPPRLSRTTMTRRTATTSMTTSDLARATTTPGFTLSSSSPRCMWPCF